MEPKEGWRPTVLLIEAGGDGDAGIMSPCQSRLCPIHKLVDGLLAGHGCRQITKKWVLPGWVLVPCVGAVPASKQPCACESQLKVLSGIKYGTECLNPPNQGGPKGWLCELTSWGGLWQRPSVLAGAGNFPAVGQERAVLLACPWDSRGKERLRLLLGL